MIVTMSPIKIFALSGSNHYYFEYFITVYKNIQNMFDCKSIKRESV